MPGVDPWPVSLAIPAKKIIDKFSQPFLPADRNFKKEHFHVAFQ
jgi:hypothetical protein